MADGNIIFSTKIDNSQMAKDLKEAEKQIRKSEQAISKAENAKLPLVEQAEQMTHELRKAENQLKSLKASAAAMDLALKPGSSPEEFINAYTEKPKLDADIKKQEAEVAGLTKKWTAVTDKIDQYDAQIDAATADLKKHQAAAGALQAKLSRGGVPVNKLFEKASKNAHVFSKRMLSIGKSAMVFSLVYAGLHKAVQYMGKMLNTNEQYRAQLAQLKGALMTAFQPIYEYVLPGLLAVMRIITMIVQMAARIFSLLTGTTAKQSAQNAEALDKEAAAIGGVGAAAKEAKRELAGFDELNILGASDAGNGGGGGGGSTAVKPDFSAFDTEEQEEKLRRIAKLVTAIGAGLLAWKIASMFTSNLSMIAGIALTVAGAVMFAFFWMDAFENGIDWENLTGMIVTLSVTALGLGLAFGVTGVAIALLVGGVALIGIALYELITTGEMTTECFVALEAGILALGLGFSLLTGSWIPLLLAAAVAVVVGIVKYGGQIKDFLTGLKDWLLGIFATDWIDLFGPVLGQPIKAFFDSLSEITSGIFRMLDGLIDFIQGVFTGNWKQAWNGVKNIFGGIFQALIGLAKAPFNGIISLVNGLLVLIVSGLNNIMGLIGKIPGVPTMSFTPPQIPYLANGAVIPPNREFMAVLGDQTNGRNLEAPEDLIRQIVREESGGGGDAEVVSLLREIIDLLSQAGVYVDGRKLAKLITKHQKQMQIAGGY